MATVNYTGNAQYATEVQTLTIAGTAAVGSKITVSCNDKSISFTVPSGSATPLPDLIAGFVAAWNDNLSATAPIGEFAEVTAAAGTTTTIVFTHNTPGMNFTYTTAGTGGVTTSFATTTAATGPNWADNVDNYDIGALPSNNDTLVIPLDSTITCGLTALAALTLGYRIYTGEPIGLPIIHTDPNVATSYPEYRTRALQIKNGASLETLIDCKSNFINLNGLAVQCTLRVNGTGTSADDTTPVVNFIGSHASNAIYAASGDVGVAFNPGEAGTVATISISYLSNQETDVKLTLGYGAAVTTLNMVGGTVIAWAPPTTTNKYGGTMTFMAGTPTTINHYTGTIDYRAGNCTTYKAFPKSVNNFFSGPSDKTITNTTVYEEAEWQDPMAVVTHTATISVPGGTPNNIKGTFGPGRSGGKLITFGA